MGKLEKKRFNSKCIYTMFISVKISLLFTPPRPPHSDLMAITTGLFLMSFGVRKTNSSSAFANSCIKDGPNSALPTFKSSAPTLRRKPATQPAAAWVSDTSTEPLGNYPTPKGQALPAFGRAKSLATRAKSSAAFVQGRICVIGGFTTTRESRISFSNAVRFDTGVTDIYLKCDPF